ncbi:MAG: ABC transporter ATP-binding protein [Syntrophobacteraceae bacterium]
MRKLLKTAAKAGEDKAETAGPWGSLGLITPYFRRHVWRIILGFLALIAVDLFQLLVPRILKSAVDALERGAATSGSLLQQAGLVMLLAVFIAALRYGWRVLLLGFSRLVESDLRNRLFSHLLILDRPFFQRVTTGDIMAHATNDLSSVQLACGMGVVAAVDAVFMGLAAFGFMLYIHPGLTVLALAPMPLLALLTRMLSARLHQRFKTVQEQFSILTEFVRSSFSNIRLIKAYNQEEPHVNRFDALGEAYVQNNIRLARIYGTLFPVAILIGNVSLLLVLVVGGRMTISQTITTGDFVAFISYLYLISWPMMALGWVADLFQRGVTSLSRIQTLLREKPSFEAVEKPLATPVTEGAILVKDLCFAFPSHNEQVLKHVHLDIRPGLFLGIVGRTGSAKTTLANLLARLYPVPDGTIFFDGMDVNRLDLGTVRGAIAYVPQEVALFSETIAYNISMGKPDATQGEIEAAARAAAIHDEIVLMKDGYQTRIGERGVKLSGGQRQRVAIARALLLDRPIVIIDDGLSAVDMETEHMIIRSIATYLRGRTCIVVSHRVAPLADANEIVVLDHGEVVARGSHRDLMETSLYYRTIYRQQTTTDSAHVHE